MPGGTCLKADAGRERDGATIDSSFGDFEDQRKDDAPVPTVSLSANAATQTAGQSVSVVWSSSNADSCWASGGESGDGWAGNLSPSGSMAVSETNPGSVTYSITCTGALPAATASTTVVIRSAASTGTSTGGGSHGGGGALDLVFLLGLGVPVGLRFGAALKKPFASEALKATRKRRPLPRSL